MPVTFGPNGTVSGGTASSDLATLRQPPPPQATDGRTVLAGRRVRRTARAYWVTTAMLTLAAPLMLMSLALLDGISAERIYSGMGAAVPFTLIALPFSFLVIAPLMALTALPFAQVVRDTRAEHALAFVGTATVVAMSLPMIFVGLPIAADGGTSLQALGAVVWFAPFGALVGAVFWRVYAGAWVWRIEEPVRVADVF